MEPNKYKQDTVRAKTTKASMGRVSNQVEREQCNVVIDVVKCVRRYKKEWNDILIWQTATK